jgi:hypothetical protein
VGIVADPEKPAAEVGARLELRQAGEGPQKGFLREVLGEVVAACEVPQPAEEGITMAFHQSSKSGLIPGLGSQDQLCIPGQPLGGKAMRLI